MEPMDVNRVERKCLLHFFRQCLLSLFWTHLGQELWQNSSHRPFRGWLRIADDIHFHRGIDRYNSIFFNHQSSHCNGIAATGEHLMARLMIQLKQLSISIRFVYLHSIFIWDFVAINWNYSGLPIDKQFSWSYYFVDQLYYPLLMLILDNKIYTIFLYSIQSKSFID